MSDVKRALLLAAFVFISCTTSQIAIVSPYLLDTSHRIASQELTTANLTSVIKLMSTTYGRDVALVWQRQRQTISNLFDIFSTQFRSLISIRKLTYDTMILCYFLVLLRRDSPLYFIKKECSFLYQINESKKNNFYTFLYPVFFSTDLYDVFGNS